MMACPMILRVFQGSLLEVLAALRHSGSSNGSLLEVLAALRPQLAIQDGSNGDPLADRGIPVKQVG